MSRLAGQTILVTGAASGLGRLIAHRAARHGAAVVLWDIDGDRLRAIERELRDAAAPGVQAMVVDVSDRAAVDAAAASLRAASIPVGILVNNAGIVTGRHLLDLTDEQIQTTFGVNVLALYWTTRAFLPDLIARGRGHIVTIASAAGLLGVSRQTDYAASKHAAVGFDESLRLELRRLGSRIRTTVVCPFYITTGMFTGVKTRFQWLLPILEPEYATDRIMHAIERDRRRLIMPRVVYTTFLGRLLPVSTFDSLMEFLGINKSMDDFVGRANH
jgi:all-trans-retinol dehydrogenase (NAD+)